MNLIVGNLKILSSLMISQLENITKDFCLQIHYFSFII